MIRIFRHLRTKEWCFVIISVLFIVAQVWLDLRLPEYMTEITELIQTEGSQMSEIYSAGGKMLLLFCQSQGIMKPMTCWVCVPARARALFAAKGYGGM